MARLYYSIGEVAERIGETVATVKFWEKEFPHFRPRKTKGGTRQYTERDIETLLSIQHLVRDKRLTIAGAREEISRKRTQIELRQNTIARLENCLERLQVLRRALLD